ncbi:MAG: NEW3 domain-containing protein [Trueperaceae bacterium]
MPARKVLRHSWLMSVFLVVGIVDSQANLNLTALAPPTELAPRQTANLVLMAGNIGDDAWNGTLEPQLPAGWRLLVPPVRMTLAPGETTTEVFSLLVPQHAEAGSYTITVLALGGEAANSVDFEVRVVAVADVEVLLLDAPGVVVAGDYTAVFAVRNGGNATAALRLTAEDNLGLRLELEVEEIHLEAGETREIAVRVGVPSDLSRSEVHLLTLRAEGMDMQPQSLGGVAEATVDLIPHESDVSSARHSFPLKLTSTSSINLGQLGGDPAAAVQRATIEVDGQGKLWDRQPGAFRIRLGTGLGSAQHRALLEYRHDEFRISLGRQSISPAPLFPELPGVGVSAKAELWPINVLRFSAEAFMLAGESGAGFGGSARFTLEESLRASAQIMTVDGESHFGTRWQLLPKPNSASPAARALDLEVEYAGRQDASGQAGRALWLGGGIAEGPLDLDVGFRARESGYDDEQSDRSTFSAAASISFGVNFPSNLEISYRLDSEYRTGTMWFPPRVIEQQDSRVEIGFDGTIAGADLGLEYTHEYRATIGETSRESQDDEVSVSVGTFLDDTQLQQRIDLRRRSGTAVDGARYSYSYSAGARSPAAGGKLTSEVELGYSRDERSFTSLNLRTAWSGAVTPDLEVIAGGDWGLVGDRVLRLDLEGRYVPDAARKLTITMGGNLYRSRSAGLTLRLAYSHDIDVPLGPLSTVGSVSGTVVDANGEPLDLRVLRVAGRSAVTQEDGSYLFPAVPEGTHQLIVHPDSLARRELTVPASPLPLEVQAGSNVQVDFRIVDAARLRGQVSFVVPAGGENTAVYGIGRPEREAELVSGILLELRGGQSVRRATSDGRGRFEFGRLPPGEWRLVATAPHLSDLYQLEPAEQTIDLTSGENTVVIELRPQERPIRFFEGGVVGDGEEPERDEGE